jgi:hypothetical protein
MEEALRFGATIGYQEQVHSTHAPSIESNPPSYVSKLIDHASMTWKADVVRSFFSLG